MWTPFRVRHAGCTLLTLSTLEHPMMIDVVRHVTVAADETNLPASQQRIAAQVDRCPARALAAQAPKLSFDAIAVCS